MAEGLHGARRPRPVADVPPPALADGEATAKAWLVALVAARPLHAVPALPTARLAAEAPRLCAAVLRAVGSDRELDRLGAGGDSSALAGAVGQLAGAPDPAGVAAAVGLLRSAAWDALAGELDPRDGELLAAVAVRLAHVCDVVAQVALGAGGLEAGVAAAGDAPPALAPVPPLPGSADADGDAEEQAGSPERRGPVGVVPDAPAPEIVARRSAGGGGEPWVDAIAVRLERHGEDGAPFTVLAVEVDEAERLLAADGDGEALRAITRAEAAVRRAARSADAVVREHPGRLWIVISAPDAEQARALGERLADAAATVSLHEAPLTVSIGFAVCPEDGADAAALAAHADEGVFAARAAGLRLA